MKSLNVFGRTFFIALFATMLTACGGRVIVDETESSCAPEDTAGQVRLMVMGPTEGTLPLGTEDALFLNIRLQSTAVCGTGILNFLSLYIESEVPNSYCASPCSIDGSDWNFQHPRLVSDSAELETQFQLGTTYDGTPVIEATFEGLAFATNETSEFEFRTTIAAAEIVPGSLVNKRFRALLGKISVAEPHTLIIDPTLPIYGGYQTVISP